MSARTVSQQDVSSLTTGDARESSHEPGVAVVIPCLNEQATIAEAVADAKAAFASWPGGVEVIVADNGSSDGSAELALAAGARVVPAVERGIGAALQAGCAAARAAYFVYADADLTYDFREGSSCSQPSSTTTPIAYLKFTLFLLYTATVMGSLRMSIFHAHLLKRA